MNTHLKLLIIEDAAADAKLLVRHIQRAGYEVEWQRVDNAHALHDALENPDWDVIISDYSMPGFTGVDALHILQNSDLDIPFIVVSGVIGEETAVKAMRAGAHDYLMKDNLQRLVPAIEREITDARERQEQRLTQDQVHILSEALAQTTNPVIITDIHGNIEYANPAFIRSTNHDLSTIINQHFRDHVNISDTAWQQFRDDHQLSTEISHIDKNGEQVWTSLRITPICDQQGTVQRYLVMQEDITLRKNYERQLERSYEREKQLNALRSRSINLISHELRTPTTVILSSVALAQQYLDSGMTDKIVNHLYRIDKNVKNLRRILNDLNFINETDIGYVIEPASIQLDTFLDDIARELTLIYPNPAKITVECASTRILLDETLLYQIISNLMSNAIKYTPSNGSIQATYTMQDNTHTLKIQDTGIGIPEHDQKDLFQAFHRASNVESISGTGLGLVIVQRAVDVLGGSITFVSKEGEGTAFTVQIPKISQTH